MNASALNRYTGLSIAGFDKGLTVYVVPNPGGDSIALACYAIDRYQAAIFGDYRVGLEILALNGALTFAGLWLISRRANERGL